MEPQIRYTTTSDGVSIAYWTLGEGGVPLVMSSPILFNHASFELRHPVLRAWYERLASRRMIVRYDVRGQGLSQRNVGLCRPAQLDTDLEEVIERLQLERFDLAAFFGPGIGHIAYAAAHPQRVRRLVLWDPRADNRDFAEGQVRAVLSLIESDWELFTETFAHTFLGWTGDLAHEWATFMRVAINQEDAANLFATIVQMDARADLPRVRAPTLVLYEAEGHRSVADSAVHVAATIPGARLLPLAHQVMSPLESGPGIRAIEDFLSDGDEAVTRAPSRDGVSSGTAIILFADIAESTALTERLGDAAFRDKARELDEALRNAITSNGGTAIEGKLLGNGIMASFPFASRALECAVAVQRSVEGQGNKQLRVHIGLNAGEPVAEERDLFGPAVQLARRICDHAKAGQILASDVVRQLAAGKGFLFAERPGVDLKGFEDPVRLYEVRWRQAETDATMRTAAAPEKSFSSGRYVVRRVLGEGGQKIVYLVHDTALDRQCALSVIKRDLLEPDDLLRLQREAQSMARLGAHSTIVTIFDIGEEDGTPYIVCEYVPGGDLRHELRTVGTLSLDRALAIAADLVEALVIAHAHGVVHRDVKPSNVWIREDGTAKLGDFGLAFSLDRSRLTMPGTFLGTASYMPPEQALGRPAEPRSDLYSLGAILYEMVTGAPPFVADDILSVISQHVNATPIPPIAQNPDLPPALDALILHLLAKSPDDRPASASEVAAEIRSLLRTGAHTS